MQQRRNIGSGIYVVIDPSMTTSVLYNKLDAVLTEKIAALQIWDNFDNNDNIPLLISELCRRCHYKDVPVLVNNHWQCLKDTALDGVHFDAVPDGYGQILAEVKRPFLCGITCTNDMQPVTWAKNNGADYISFCSMFPSGTVESCELVSHDSVRRASAIYDGPIFLAGGIKPDNVGKLRHLPYTGIAVISGVMDNDAPDQSIREYLRNEE